MIASPYPLELTLGMRYYATDERGIGGRLRRSAEDFAVEECSTPPSGSGPYLIVRLTQRDWELQHAVKEIAKRLGISHRRIGWAGTKDRRAVTTQLISIYGVSPEDLARVQLKEIRLEPIGTAGDALSLGQLAGNRFAIWIRGCTTESLAERVGTVTESARHGLPNYVGYQRFGVIRPVTHLVGERILAEDYEGAVLAYVGMPFPAESEEIRSAREDYSATLDAAQALRRFPRHLSYERAMLHHLAVHPADHAGALRVLPPKLLSIFVSAFQSYLFNCGLSDRMAAGCALDEPVPGDLLLFPDGKTDIVTARAQRAAALQVRRGRACIAIALPGAAPGGDRATSPGVRCLLDEKGLTPDSFRRAAAFVGTAFAGTARSVALATEIETRTEGDAVFLDFTLGPGQYATTVCREYMKADPLCMV
ncbi:MAG: tRNA pseudouridine(13) synthase TruD [Methanobacteriota archaeon]|nr:MAG: tRNA pseudouridine(13) synthase TruD [Euryarchaeota archaeon]